MVKYDIAVLTENCWQYVFILEEIDCVFFGQEAQ